MFSNPLGQMFGKPDEPEKKKKRAKRVKKLSPEASEEAASSLSNSKSDLNSGVTFEEVPGEVEQAKCSGLMDIVNEINSAPLVEEPVEEINVEEPTETRYEELPVDESMMKAVIEGISSQNNEQEVNSPAQIVEDCWETMLNTPPNEESTWESEVHAAPQSSDSVWESMLSTSHPPVVSSEQHSTLEPVQEVAQETAPETTEANSEIRDQFKLKEGTFELAREFFDEQKDDGLLKNDLLKYLLKNAISQRMEMVDVTEEDVDRALKTVDSDNDDKVNFDEFVQLLALFFSSKNNIKQRISGVLNNQASVHHEKAGSLTASEAHTFSHYLHNFFGKHDDELVKHRENFLSKLIKKVIKKKEKKVKKAAELDEIHEIDYSTFTDEAADELKELCFVKFID